MVSSMRCPSFCPRRARAHIYFCLLYTSGLTGAEVVTGCEVTAVNAAAHTVTARKDGQAFEESYDRLVIATGAEPIVPDMPGAGLPGVFCMRTPDDAVGLLSYVKANGCRRAAVVGAGFIGLEAAENLMAQGLSVTVIDAAPQVMPNAFDPEMAEYVKRKLRQAGMRVQTGCRIEAVSYTHLDVYKRQVLALELCSKRGIIGFATSMIPLLCCLNHICRISFFSMRLILPLMASMPVLLK